MPPTTLYLIRHGAADGHDGDDPGLSDAGRAQAHRAAAALGDLGVDTVLHGSRRRAAETARIIADACAGTRPAHSDWFEDRTPVPEDWASVPARYHEFLRSVPVDEADPGATALSAAVAAMSSVGERDRTIIAVTHNFVIGWIVRNVLDAPWWRWIGLNQVNGAITVVRWSHDQGGRLVRFNDQGHLDPADRAG